MAVSRRWLKRFHVLVHGTDFCFDSKDEDGTKKIIGFYTNRWIDAFDRQSAEAKALASVRLKLSGKVYASLLNSVRLHADEISEVSFWTKRFARVQGFAFYPEEANNGPRRS